MNLQVVKSESKSENDAINKCLEELNVNMSEVYYHVSEASGLFGKKKYIAYVTTKYEVKEFVKEFLVNLAHKMNTVFNIEVKENEGVISAVIVSENNALLIGKDGNTLKSIQLILRQALRKYGDFDIKANLDIAGYKAKREKNISYEVKKIAREVSKTHIEAKLDPMNSYERRIAHMAIQSFKNVYTESVGEEPNRCVVIKYKED